MIAYSKINIREDRIVTMKDDRVFLLTGAAGFLGNNIAKQLMEKGCYVRKIIEMRKSYEEEKNYSSSSYYVVIGYSDCCE